MADALLVRQAYAGDASAFALLVSRYQNMLHNFVCTFLGRDEAEDLVQFVWLQCYRHLPDLQKEPLNAWRGTAISLKAWLFRVATNRCLDELRKKRRRSMCFFSELEYLCDEEEFSPWSSLPDPDPLPEEIAEQHDIRQTLHRAISRLPTLYRAIVELRYAEELSFAEIGSRLQISANTAKTYYHRACAKLRTTLSDSREEGKPGFLWRG